MKAEVPIPSWYDPKKVEAPPWRVDYMDIEQKAKEWAKQNGITPAITDTFKVLLLAIDMQYTFSHPDFELYVGGRDGLGGLRVTDLACQFQYRNTNNITRTKSTMDTHWDEQIFHRISWIDQHGNHPDPGTQITEDDVLSGKWKINPMVAGFMTGGNYPYLAAYAIHYIRTLKAKGRYALTIWPYHAMLGGIGHTLMASIHEAQFAHSIARYAGNDFEVKGGVLLSENYSVAELEVEEDQYGNALGDGSLTAQFFDSTLSYDAVVMYGLAWEYCLAWSIDSILKKIASVDPSLARKIYIMEDCTAPVVIPAIGLDGTDLGQAAFEKFAKAGMNIVKSTTPMKDWPGMK
jgi:nicotinamidase-related amidase